MKRWELVTSNEYFETYVECIVVSRKPIRIIRKELNKFIERYRDELLHGDRGTYDCGDDNCKVCYPHKK